jgi:hypothetical protein
MLSLTARQRLVNDVRTIIVWRHVARSNEAFATRLRRMNAGCRVRGMATPKRSAARPKAAPAAPAVDRVPDLVIRGLSAADVAALVDETAARNAALPEGASMTRNAVAVIVFRAGLDAVRKAREGAST